MSNEKIHLKNILSALGHSIFKVWLFHGIIKHILLKWFGFSQIVILMQLVLYITSNFVGQLHLQVIVNVSLYHVWNCVRILIWSDTLHLLLKLLCKLNSCRQVNSTWDSKPDFKYNSKVKKNGSFYKKHYKLKMRSIWFSETVLIYVAWYVV